MPQCRRGYFLRRPFFEDENAGGFEHSRKFAAVEQQLREPLPRLCFLIRRIGKNNSERVRQACGTQERKNLLFAYGPFKFRPAQVPLDRRNRRRIFLYKQRRSRSPAERLDPERARSCEQVEYVRAHNELTETRKNRRLHPIHRRAHAVLRNIELDAARCAGDHSHGVALGVADAGAAAGVDAAAAGSSAGFFFFSDLPPPINPVITLLRSLRSRPISLSIRFVLARPTVPPT